MTTNVAKWTDERTNTLVNIVGPVTGTPVSKEQVVAASESLETTTRSVAAKLRKLGYEVASLAAEHTSKFDKEDTEDLRATITSNPNAFTYASLAAEFKGGKYSSKVLQGKVMSLELTSLIAPAEKVETVRTYTPAEEANFIKAVEGGAFLEDIAEVLGKSLNSVRGKALSLLRSKQISAIPKQRESHADAEKTRDVLEGLDIATLTVAQIAEKTGKTERGIKTMLTKRGLIAVDYDGASKKEKAAEKKAA